MAYTLFDIETDGLLPDVSLIHCLCYQTFEDGEKPVFRTRYRFGSEFSLDGQEVDPKEWYLKINNEYIKHVHKTKFLGIIIDDNLKWEDHIKTIESKVSKNLGLLYQARNVLDLKAM